MDMSPVPTSGTIELCEFDWGYGRRNHEISQTIEESFREIFKEDPPWCYLPFRHDAATDGNGGPPVSDPLTIDVSLGALHHDETVTGPTWRISLSELVKDLLEDHRYSDGSFDENSVRLFQTMAAELRKLADEIDPPGGLSSSAT